MKTKNYLNTAVVSVLNQFLAVDWGCIVPNRQAIHLQARHVIKKTPVVVDDVSPGPEASILDDGRFCSAEKRQTIQRGPDALGIVRNNRTQALVEFDSAKQNS